MWAKTGQIIAKSAKTYIQLRGVDGAIEDFSKATKWVKGKINSKSQKSNSNLKQSKKNKKKF